MDRKGILLVVSGFSGAGKGTLMKDCLLYTSSPRLHQRRQRHMKRRNHILDKLLLRRNLPKQHPYNHPRHTAGIKGSQMLPVSVVKRSSGLGFGFLDVYKRQLLHWNEN